ncbi:endonuclease/exonuclease/phosphatase family protein [Allokutzneria albata]|uniref:Metal-dependent hydrolase, endonuclease/exonuclease/phosphatase family n=1 Tax=Allokutzneria albata TaxID=211114 RepID=A0A1G9V850_ALLAB|nr:endonuclease/exonuclease/phosphatase family protein [Allokutzneria albata]SDM68392.1 Metal-dependent hydrolase, endonuclease/exonuclease/phosphatase family [Allokutzneria albata]
MKSVKRTAFGAVMVCVLAAATGCREDPPPPPDTSVTVVNLNAAMGFVMGPGEDQGTDATPEDLALLADDILKHPADVVNLQEMAVYAARDLRELLAGRTGAVWQLNWAHSDFADYYAGKEPGEAPVWKNASAGNAQLIRIGAGVRSQKPITVDGDRPAGEPDQGIMLPSSRKPNRGRSFQGAEIVTEHGVIDVYNLHLARAKDNSDEERARDVETIQRLTESRTNPAIITGDFNETIDLSELYPGPHAYPGTFAALSAFMNTYGYTDVAKDLGATSNRAPKHDVQKLVSARIDYILARGLRTVETAKFASAESDHWGLVTTVEPGSERGTPKPAPSTGVSADRFRHALPGGGTFYFFTSADAGYSCAVVAKQALCQGRTKPVPPPPDSCKQRGGPSWGHGMFVEATGKVDFVCAGGLVYSPVDRAPDDRDVLRPGQSFTALGFTCAAEERGIRCRNASGRGFFIAPDTNERF